MSSEKIQNTEITLTYKHKDEDIKKLAERAVRVATFKNIELPVDDETGEWLSGEELDHYFSANEDSIAEKYIKRGITLHYVKRILPRNQFMAWYQDHGISKDVAAKSMGIAEMFLESSPEMLEYMRSFSISNLDQIRKLPIERREELREVGFFDNLKDLSRDDIKALVQEQVAHTKTKEKLHKAHNEIRDLIEEKKINQMLDSSVDYAADVRAAILAITGGFKGETSNLTAVVKKLAVNLTIMGDHHGRAVEDVMWSLKQIYAEISCLTKLTNDLLGEYIDENSGIAALEVSDQEYEQARSYLDLAKITKASLVSKVTEPTKPEKPKRGRPEKKRGPK